MVRVRGRAREGETESCTIPVYYFHRQKKINAMSEQPTRCYHLN